MELYVLATLAGHTLLAAGVGAHAEITGRRRWPWVPLVLLTGVFGALVYGRRSTAGEVAAAGGPGADASDAGAWNGSATVDDADQLPEERPDWLDRRSRAKRLADPGSLHVDLPDGTTLTSKDQAAVAAAVEFREERPDADADELVETVFEESPAGYDDPDVWWTDCVFPALSGLPEVDPPLGAERRTLDLSVREVERLEDRRVVRVEDGRRHAEFSAREGEVWAADGDAVARTSPGWMRLAHGAAEAWAAEHEPTPAELSKTHPDAER